MTVRESKYPSGSLWSLRRVRQDPIAFLGWLAGMHGDLAPFSIAGQRAFLLNHPDHVHDVLVSNDRKFGRPYAFERATGLLGLGLLTAEGDLHRRRRRLIQPAFTRPAQRYGTIVAECAAALHERWSDRDVVDMAREMADLTLNIIGRALFSADLSPMAHDIRRAVAAASASLDPLVSLFAPARRFRRDWDRLRAAIDSLIAQRLASPDQHDDLLSTLCGAAEADGDAGGEQTRDDVLTLVLAGHDTIAHTLVWTWLQLARHPAVERRLREEVKTELGGRAPGADDLPALTYTAQVLAESLRLHPPAWVMARRALEDHAVDGTVIPAGSLVLASQYLLHRDARFFPDPLVFDPDRWAIGRQTARPKLAYFPFGAGPRSCIGETFASMEGALILASIAQHWQCRTRPGDDVELDARFTLRPTGPVPMIVHSPAGRDACRTDRAAREADGSQARGILPTANTRGREPGGEPCQSRTERRAAGAGAQETGAGIRRR